MWKDIPEYEGFYQINEFGEIKNVKTNKKRSLRIKKNGYIDVDLYKNGQVKWERVHILVAKTFIPNPNHLPIVMHKDNNKSNNCLYNLKWGTISENTKSAYDDKLFVHSKLLKYRVYNNCIGFSKEYNGAKEIQKDLGISINTICFYANHPDKKMLRKPFRGYQIEVIGKVADIERSTTIL